MFKRILLILLFMACISNSVHASMLHDSINWDRISWLEIFWNKHAILPACMFGAFVINSLWWKRSYKKVQRRVDQLEFEKAALLKQKDERTKLRQGNEKLKGQLQSVQEAYDNLIATLKIRGVTVEPKKIINHAESAVQNLQEELKKLEKEKNIWQTLALTDNSLEMLIAIKQNVLQMQIRSELTSLNEEKDITDKLTNLGFSKAWSMTGKWFSNDVSKNFPAGTIDKHPLPVQKDFLQDCLKAKRKFEKIKTMASYVSQIGIVPRETANRDNLKKLCNKLGFKVETEQDQGLLFVPK